MKIKFIKDYAINRGACPLNIGGFDMLETEIVKADTVVDLEKDNGDGAFSDELIKWLIDNGFAKEVKESGWWKPKEGEGYYFLAKTGKAGSDPWYTDELDEFRYSVGNCFKTKAAAERYRDYLKAIATVRQDEGVLTPEQATKNGRVYYIRSHAVSGLGVYGFDADYVSVNTVLFDTKEHAQASLDEHPDEWKIIANYDWSRE